MVTVVTREENGIPLTHEQVDTNFTNLATAVNSIGADVLAEAVAAKDVAVAAAGSASASAGSASNSANAASISSGSAATSAEAATSSAFSASASASASAASALDSASYVAGLTYPSGSSNVGFQQAGTDAAVRNLQAKSRERVSISDFKLPEDTDDTASVVRAIASGARKIAISIAAVMSSGVALAANQAVDWDGGMITMAAGSSAPNGVFYASNKAGIKLIDPLIDCLSTPGLGGISLTDCPGATIVDGLLIKSNLALISTNNTIRSAYKVRGLVINMSGLLVTSAYISGVKVAKFSDVECFGGKEGFGLYNGCVDVSFSNCYSNNHTQDGFVIIKAKGTTHTGCHSYSNGQSGFTTQRITAGTDCLETKYTACDAYLNAYDGFDMRGANSSSWSVPMRTTLTGCHAYQNSGTGFYIVYAEGVTLSGCQATLNLGQGLFIQNSPGVTVSGFQSGSNCASLAADTFNAGVLVANSPNCVIGEVISGNTLGASQRYGISFVGASTGCSLSGAALGNNITAPYNIDSTCEVSIASSSIQVATNKWLISRNGKTNVDQLAGFGIPSFPSQKGSTFQRSDGGGGGELYICDGGTTWHQLT